MTLYYRVIIVFPVAAGLFIVLR